MKDRSKFQYVNPFSLLGLDSHMANQKDYALIRQKSKIMLAEIELDDGHAIPFEGTWISKSDFHEIINDLDDPRKYGLHQEILENGPLLGYLHTSTPSLAAEVKISSNDLSIFVQPYLAFSASLTLESLCSSFINVQWIAAMNLIEKIPSSYYDRIFEPVAKRLREATGRIESIHKGFVERSIVDLEAIPNTLRKEITESLSVQAITNLPPYCSSFRSNLAVSLGDLSEDVQNKSHRTDIAINILEIAIEIPDDSVLQKKCSEFLKHLHTLLGTQDNRIAGVNALHYLNQLLVIIRKNPGRNMDLEGLNKRLSSLFPPQSIDIIVLEGKETYCDQVSESVWKICFAIGLSRSRKILEIFEPVLKRHESAKALYASKIRDLKKEMTSYSIFRIGLMFLVKEGIRLLVRLIPLFTLLAIGIALYQCDRDEPGPANGNSSNRAEPPEVHSKLSPGIESIALPWERRKSPQLPETEDYENVSQYKCSNYHLRIVDGMKPSTLIKSKIIAKAHEIDSVFAELNRLSEKIKSTHADKSNRASIGLYNGLVDDYNLRFEIFNKKKKGYDVLVDRLNTQVKIYNDYLSANCLMRN